jgi:hypothetical protein
MANNAPPETQPKKPPVIQPVTPPVTNPSLHDNHILSDNDLSLSLTIFFIAISIFSRGQLYSLLK